MDNANAASEASPKQAKSSLSWRLISGVVPLPLLLFAIYWDLWLITLVVAIATVIALLEFYYALRHAGYQPRRGMGTISALLFCGAAFLQETLHVDLTSIALSGSLLLTLATELSRRDYKNCLICWSITFAGACYVGWFLSYYIQLRGLDTPLHSGWLASLHLSSGAVWVYFALAITWMQDASAYFVGRAFGRHRLAPNVSPKKSWEGAIGGFLTSVGMALLCVPLFGLPITLLQAALLGMTAGIIGPTGDLVESLFKRQVGIKDMSNILPGHGGLLDRIDSILFTGPVLYYLILFFTRV